MSNLSPHAIAESITQARKAMGLNQSELARAVGVTPQAVQKWEAGTAMPRYGVLSKVAAVLGLETVGLTTVSGHPFSNAERLVARVVSAKPMDTANENDVDAGGYIGPIADAVIRGDLSDAAMASLGRELLQVYQRDVIGLVIAADEEMEAAVLEAERQWNAAMRALPTAVLPHRGVTV